MPPRPARPILTIAAVGLIEIHLAWSYTNKNITGFKLERSLANTLIFTEIATLGKLDRTYIDKPLPSSTTFIYRLRAYKGSTYSHYSDMVTATTLTPEPEPSPVGPLPEGDISLSIGPSPSDAVYSFLAWRTEESSETPVPEPVGPLPEGYIYLMIGPFAYYRVVYQTTSCPMRTT
jgi:hypothetical protein